MYHHLEDMEISKAEPEIISDRKVSLSSHQQEDNYSRDTLQQLNKKNQELQVKIKSILDNENNQLITFMTLG